MYRSASKKGRCSYSSPENYFAALDLRKNESATCNRYRTKCVKEHVFAEWDGGVAHDLVKWYSQVRAVSALIYCVHAHLAFVLPCFEQKGCYIVDVLKQPLHQRCQSIKRIKLPHGASGKAPLCTCFTISSLEGDLIHHFSKNRGKNRRKERVAEGREGRSISVETITHG